MDGDDRQNHPTDELTYRNQLKEEFTHRFNFDTRLSHIEVEQEQEQALFEQLHTHDDQVKDVTFSLSVFFDH